MKIEDFKELKNFLPSDIPIEIETQQIKTQDFEKAVTSSGSIAENIERMVVVNIERKVLEEFAYDIINWGKNRYNIKVN